MFRPSATVAADADESVSGVTAEPTGAEVGAKGTAGTGALDRVEGAEGAVAEGPLDEPEGVEGTTLGLTFGFAG